MIFLSCSLSNITEEIPGTQYKIIDYCC